MTIEKKSCCIFLTTYGFFFFLTRWSVNPANVVFFLSVVCLLCSKGAAAVGLIITDRVPAPRPLLFFLPMRGTRQTPFFRKGEVIEPFDGKRLPQ